MILPALNIRRAAPIAEMVERCKAFGMTYGLGPAGYDVRINCTDALMERGDFMLAATVERFQMPDDLMGIVHDKSTWARRGQIVQPARSARRPSRCHPFRATLVRVNNDTTVERSPAGDQLVRERDESLFLKVADDGLTIHRMIRRATKIEPRIRSRIRTMPMISDNTKELDALATLTNHGRVALSLHWGMPIAQIVFHRLEQPSPAAKHRPMDWRNTVFLDLQ